MSGIEITDAMIDAAADAYEEGLQPGDEYAGLTTFRADQPSTTKGTEQ